MPFAALWGEAAQRADDSMRSWQELFQRQDQAEKDRKHQKQLAQQQHEMAVDRLGLEQAFEVGGTLLNQAMEGALPFDQLNMLEGQLEELGAGALSPMLSLVYPQSIFRNPDQALAMIQQVTAAAVDPEAAIHVNPALADSAFNYIATTSGWDEETRTKQRKDFDMMLEAAMGQRGPVAEGLATRFAAETESVVNKAREISARADVLEVQAETAWTKLEELFPLEVERAQEEIHQLQENVRLISAQANLAEIEEQFRPELFSEQLAQMAIDTETGELNLEILQATQDAIIEETIAQAELATMDVEMSQLEKQNLESRLRVQLATEATQVLIAEEELDGVRANTKQILQSIKESRERIDRSRAEQELAEREMALLEREGIISATTVLTDLVEDGQVEAIREIGPELLRGLGVKDPERLLEGWLERANESLTRRKRRQLLELDIATADRDLKLFQVETMEERYELEVHLAKAGLELQIDENAIRWYDAETRRQQVDLQRQRMIFEQAGITDATFYDEDIFDRMGFTANQFQTLIRDVLDSKTDSLLKENQHNRDALDAQGWAKYNTLLGWTSTFFQTARQLHGLEVTAETPIQDLMLLLPPALRGDLDDELVSLLLLDMGITRRTDAGDIGFDLDPTDTQTIGKAFTQNAELRTDPDQRHRATQVAWENMTDDQREEWGTFRDYRDEVEREMDEEQASLQAQGQALEYITEAAGQLLLLRPLAGERFLTPGQLPYVMAELQPVIGRHEALLDRATSKLRRLQEDPTVDTGRMRAELATLMRDFDVSFPLGSHPEDILRQTINFSESLLKELRLLRDETQFLIREFNE